MCVRVSVRVRVHVCVFACACVCFFVFSCYTRVCLVFLAEFIIIILRLGAEIF